MQTLVIILQSITLVVIIFMIPTKHEKATWTDLKDAREEIEVGLSENGFLLWRKKPVKSSGSN